MKGAGGVLMNDKMGPAPLCPSPAFGSGVFSNALLDAYSLNSINPPDLPYLREGALPLSPLNLREAVKKSPFIRHPGDRGPGNS